MMNDRFLYLTLSLILLLPCGIVFWMRADLRRKMTGAGIVTAIAAVVGEYWHFRDYWRPPTTMGVAVVSPEDVLFGIALGGLAVSLYDVILRTKDAPGSRPRRSLFLILLCLGLVSLFVFSSWLGYNSLLVSIVGFLIAAAVMLTLRPDLLRVSLLSGLLLGGLAFLAYLFLFTWLAPHYWHRYWLLEGTALGWTVLEIPWTEILWYVAWGVLAGIIPNVVRGTVKQRL